MVSVPSRRRQVAFAKERGLSKRRACHLFSVSRLTLGRESRLAERDQPVIEAMRELARQNPRYGYRRIQVFLAREGFELSAQRAHQLWQKATLQIPRKRSRRRKSLRGDPNRGQLAQPITCGPMTSCSTEHW